MWDPYSLMNPLGYARPLLTTEQTQAVKATDRIHEDLDIDGYDSWLIHDLGPGSAIVYMQPVRFHVHDQDCARA